MDENKDKKKGRRTNRTEADDDLELDIRETWRLLSDAYRSRENAAGGFDLVCEILGSKLLVR